MSYPGGLAYHRFPVNANEAEARRSRRFEPFGHSPKSLDRAKISEPPPDHGYPRTLDLRKVRS